MQGLRKVAMEELANVEGDLQREAKEDAELRERHGAAWRRPSSAALNAKFLEKVAGEHCNQHKVYHTKHKEREWAPSGFMA
jgi:hypothetical protein